MYLVRLADPVGVVRMHLSAPMQSMTARSNLTISGVPYSSGALINPAHWPNIAAIQDVSAFPEWGPLASHQYDGMAWDGVHEKLIVGGDVQASVSNPMAYGSQPQLSFNILIFDPYAPNPQAAWTRLSYSTGPLEASGGVYALVDNPDGTFSFRTRGSVGTLNVSSKSVVMGSTPGAGPLGERYSFWRPCFRDPDTNKYFEIQRRDLGNPYTSGDYTHSVFECRNGGYVKICDLPAGYRGSQDTDTNCSGVVVNGFLFLWSATSLVIRVRLSSGEVTSFSDATDIAQPESGFTGVNGRWAFVPQVSAFVGLSSEHSNIYVFRPPASWMT